MAFVNKRNKNIRSIDRNNGIEVETQSVNNQVEGSQLSPRAKSFEEIKTYRDQAIEVINILEQQGIDIYDKERTPGMYLKRNYKSSSIVKKLSSIDDLADSQSQNEQNKPVNGLLNFFNNK